MALFSSCEENKVQYTVDVSNTLDAKRSHETISVSIGKIPLVENQTLAVYATGSEEALVSQLVDLDEDGKWDEVLFQPEIEAKGSQQFEIRVIEDTQKGQPLVLLFSIGTRAYG